MSGIVAPRDDRRDRRASRGTPMRLRLEARPEPSRLMG